MSVMQGDCVAKVFLRRGTQILRAVGATIEARLTLAAWPPQSKDADRRPAACIIPIADHNMSQQPFAITLPPTAWSAPWAGAATPTTTLRRKASRRRSKSRPSPKAFHVSLRRSTTADGFTRRSAISAPRNSRRDLDLSTRGYSDSCRAYMWRERDGSHGRNIQMGPLALAKQTRDPVSCG
jgi:hypothetical protein